DGRVLEAMLPYYGAQFGNPHSIGYARAEMSRVAVEKARWQVAQLIGAEPEDIIFTAGATEACNLALRGLFEPREKAAKGRPVPRLL
ncbi:aminotransferase class V-fold PLP-dependent enzyme, partial [Escherichia coli]|nr:aminotransferase class V-fold PLP-dependent enzyme [Escherichia coli]